MKNRMYSVMEIKAVDDEQRKFKGIATTITTDRTGDIVEPKGGQFNLPIPFIWQHDAGDPIGWITAAKATDTGIEIEGEVANIKEEGPLRDRLATAWQMIKNRLVRGLSIGFNSIESAGIDGTYGIHFTKWEWLELSAVTIPANQEATITTIKSLYKSQAAPGQNFPGVTGYQKKAGEMKTLAEQLAELQAARQLKAARMSEISQSIVQKSATSEDTAEFDTLSDEVSQLDNDIRVKKAELVTSKTAQPVHNPVKAPTVITKKTDADEAFPGQAYTRMVIAKAVAQLDSISPIAVANHRWSKSNPALCEIIKTAVAGGGTGSGEWGAELVQINNQFTGDFIEYLYGQTVFDKLALRAVPKNVLIKGQDGAAGANWVGESKAIPASKADFSDVNLTGLKVAALAVISNDLLRDSSPAAEMLVRDALVEASAQKVDTTFFSTAAASAGVSPAGMLNGVSAESASGDDAAALRADLYTLRKHFIDALNSGGLSYVMNPSLAASIELMTNALGIAEFPDITEEGGRLPGGAVVTGDNIDANHMILLKPSDIWKIGDGGVEVSLSREAVIEMDDAPANASDTPAGATGALVSMFQTESTAIKVVRPINFAKRRTGVVQYVNDAAYGAATT